ncbi:MAG: rolling circle replication-associated protein [archaeon]
MIDILSNNPINSNEIPHEINSKFQRGNTSKNDDYNTIYKNIINSAKKEMMKSPFYCDGVTYNSIDDIPTKDDTTVEYYKKIKNMKFSDGTYLNIENSLWYAKLCYAFECHLDNVKKAKLEFTLEDLSKIEKSLEYRNSESYKKFQVKKYYKLMESLKELPEHEQGVTLVTLTTYQKIDGHGIDYISQYQKLNTARKKLHDRIRQDHRGVQYVYVTETHKTGYLHYHFVYNCEFTEEEMTKYRLLWSDKYKVGSFENGIDFQYNDNINTSQTIDAKNNGYDNVTSSISYLIKYIYKSISAENQNTPFYQFLSDALIWYVSRNHNGYKGIRTQMVSQKWLNELIIPKLVDESIEEQRVYYKLMKYKKGEELIHEAVINGDLNSNVIYGFHIDFIKVVLYYCGHEIVLKDDGAENTDNIKEQLITPTIPSPPDINVKISC